MEFLKTKTEDHIYHILLDRGKSNAMHSAVIDELIEALNYAESDPAIAGS